jgi:carbamoyl-phosphate synthase large subunit
VPEVIEAAIRTAQAIGVRCVANVQFKRAADGVFKLLEVNPRFPGTLPLTIAAGVDMPKLMVDEVAGKALPDQLVPFKELMVVRYWTEHYFAPQEWKALCQPP